MTALNTIVTPYEGRVSVPPCPYLSCFGRVPRSTLAHPNVQRLLPALISASHRTRMTAINDRPSTNGGTVAELPELCPTQASEQKTRETSSSQSPARRVCWASPPQVLHCSAVLAYEVSRQSRPTRGRDPDNPVPRRRAGQPLWTSLLELPDAQRMPLRHCPQSGMGPPSQSHCSFTWPRVR